MTARSPEPDTPVSFGYKCAWYALYTNDMDAVVSALGLRGAIASTWGQGVEGAYAGKVFVTPPLGDWILAAGVDLFCAGGEPAPSVAPVLTKLSKVFGEAQYFATYRVVEAHCWALARDGKMLRGYCFVGDRGESTWNDGEQTAAERALGIGGPEFPGPDENQLMQLAGAWSVDPSELESDFTEPGLGQLGELA
jgi:hypothetical protein